MVGDIRMGGLCTPGITPRCASPPYCWRFVTWQQVSFINVNTTGKDAFKKWALFGLFGHPLNNSRPAIPAATIRIGSGIFFH